MSRHSRWPAPENASAASQCTPSAASRPNRKNAHIRGRDARRATIRVSLMKIATWNINSVRRRLPLVLDWLAKNQPDVLCLQETKVPDEQFPAGEFRGAGYHAAFRGMKSYN